MLILAIDTALAACSVAFAENGRILARSWEAMPRGHAERLIPMLEDTREDAGVAYDTLDLIMVTVGPGTFTGVRVGLAAARGLGLACGCPVQGVGTLEALACATGEGSPVLASIDARRGELYWQRFAANGRPESAARLDSIEAVIAAQSGKSGRLVGSGSELLSGHLPAWSLSNVAVNPDAAIIARHYPRFASAIAGQPPKPLYLRAPDAKLPS